MSNTSTAFKISKTSKVIFGLSIFVFVFWTLAGFINIYDIIIAGAIFEFLWFPVMALMLLLPILSIYFLIKEGFNFRSLYVYTLIIIGLTFLVLTKQKI